MLKHYVAGFLLQLFGILVVAWLCLMEVKYLSLPGNSIWIYINIGLIFVNVYTVIKSMIAQAGLRKLLKEVFAHAAILRNMETNVKKQVTESIRNIRHEKNQRSQIDNNLQS